MQWRRPTSSTPARRDPILVRRVVNPNAYDVAIPPEWGISSTFNIGDLVAYQGPLEIPTEPGLSPYSTESSLSAPAENYGDHTPRDITCNGPDPVTELEASAESKIEVDGTRSSEYFYF